MRSEQFLEVIKKEKLFVSKKIIKCLIKMYKPVAVSKNDQIYIRSWNNFQIGEMQSRQLSSKCVDNLKTNTLVLIF